MMIRFPALLLAACFCFMAGAATADITALDTDQMVERKLARKVTVVKKNAMLKDAIELLAKETKIEFDVNWDQLELVGADDHLPVKLNYVDRPGKQVLEEVLKVASQDGVEPGDRIGYVIKRGKIIVDTHANLGLK